ncbi:hypothetical protein BGZ57DRAFT_992966 [Hyaloscypha finlandica]|nr:hypothetical protein BGZ57DRAFT_992966 [Hyaloscypha finlandica]
MGFLLQSCLVEQSSQCNTLSSFVNVTVLSTAQKLAPNNDITGKTVVRIFIGITFTVLILSLILLADKVHMHSLLKKNKTVESKYPLYPRAIHTIESVMEHLFQQQLLAGFALIWVVANQACTISAYHYNLVCIMLVLSVITQLNVLINIPDFVNKNIATGYYHIILVSIQLVLSLLMLAATDSKAFPIEASSLAVVPAQCFIDIAAAYENSSSSNTSQNLTTHLSGNITASNATNTSNTTASDFIDDALKYAANATWNSTIVNCLIIFAIMTYVVVIYDVVSIIGSTILVGFTLRHYVNLRSKQEVEAWFLVGREQGYTFSQVLPLLMAAGGVAAIIRALFDSAHAFNNRRWANYITQAVKAGKDDQVGYRSFRKGEMEAGNGN